MHSAQLTLSVVYAHFAKRTFEIETENTNRFKIVPNKYINIDDDFPFISEKENNEYAKAFSNRFRINKIKRALGIFKYIEKVWKKRRFMPL